MKLLINGLAKLIIGIVLIGLLPMPLILQSLWGLIPFAIYPVVIIIRIINEEKVLENGLEGYSEYKTRVKYRLIPFIW